MSLSVGIRHMRVAEISHFRCKAAFSIVQMSHNQSERIMRHEKDQAFGAGSSTHG